MWKCSILSEPGESYFDESICRLAEETVFLRNEVHDIKKSMKAKAADKQAKMDKQEAYFDKFPRMRNLLQRGLPPMKSLNL